MIPGLVTVMIPTKDRPHYLLQAVESVLAQTYPQIEMILIDDGSAKGGAKNREALLPFLSLPNLTILYQENKGVGAALNRGLSLAKGEYIQRLDDDDRLLPEKIERSVSVFQANPSLGLVATGWYLIDEKGLRYQTLSPRPCPNPARFLNMLLRCVSAQVGVMVRASVHQKVGAYRTDLLGEDYEMWIRIAKEFDVLTISEPLAEYRRHPGNATCLSNQANLGRDLIRCLEEHLSQTPLSGLVPSLQSPPHALALRAAIYLARDGEFQRTTDRAKEELDVALHLLPKDPLLSLWKGVLAVHGDESLRPLPWDDSLPEASLSQAQELAQFVSEQKRLDAMDTEKSEAARLFFRRQFGRFFAFLIAETYQRAIGK